MEEENDTRYYSCKSVNKKDVKLLKWENYKINSIDQSEKIFKEEHRTNCFDDAKQPFDLFFTREIKDHIIRCSNESENIKNGKYKPITPEEFDAFLGLIILMGYNGDNQKSTKHLFSKKWNKIYCLIMSRNRFEEILYSLKFDPIPSEKKKKEKNEKEKVVFLHKGRTKETGFESITNFYNEEELNKIVVEKKKKGNESKQKRKEKTENESEDESLSANDYRSGSSTDYDDYWWSSKSSTSSSSSSSSSSLKETQSKENEEEIEIVIDKKVLQSKRNV